MSSSAGVPNKVVSDPTAFLNHFTSHAHRRLVLFWLDFEFYTLKKHKTLAREQHQHQFQFYFLSWRFRGSVRVLADVTEGKLYSVMTFFDPGF